MLTKILDKKLGSSIFTGRQIISMLMPLIMDSFFVFGIGVLTTAMISSSSQESVAAISLVGPLYMMVYAINNAISAGGTVVVAMFKGKGETERVKEAAGQLIVGLPLSSLAACILLVLCADPLIRFLFHGMEETILVKAEHYLIGVAISAVFLSVYMSGFAVFRGLGETKKCLHLSILINVLHFVASFVFINILKLDIMGSALSLNLARLVGGMAAVLMLISKKSSIEIRPRHVFRIDWRIQKEIFRIGIPCGMEQLFMNGGAMLVQVYIAKLGTASVAANAVSNSILCGTVRSCDAGCDDRWSVYRCRREKAGTPLRQIHGLAVYCSGVIVTGDRNAVYSDSVKALSGTGRNGSDDLPGTDHCGSLHAVFLGGIQCASFCHAFGR